MQSRYDAAEQWRNKLASSVVFHTPDAYINPIGGALVMAADGAWTESLAAWSCGLAHVFARLARCLYGRFPRHAG